MTAWAPFGLLGLRAARAAGEATQVRIEPKHIYVKKLQ